MELRIGNKIIDEDMEVILKDLRNELPYGYFRDIKRGGQSSLLVSCPSHKGGQENHASCLCCSVQDDPKFEYGEMHCLACGYTKKLPEVIADLFGSSMSVAEQWLVDHYGDVFVEKSQFFKGYEIENSKQYGDESELEKYRYYHPYMYQRKLTNPIIEKFDIGYDSETNCITFPVWDAKGHYLFVTKRNVSDKQFHIPKDVEKPVYLLNFVIQEGYDEVYVCESQINALTLWTYGLPAVALFGTGTYEQIQILNKSGIRHFILCFDPDDAGLKGINRFLHYVKKDALVDVVKFPKKRDVNDLSQQEFMYCRDKALNQNITV